MISNWTPRQTNKSNSPSLPKSTSKLKYSLFKYLLVTIHLILFPPWISHFQTQARNLSKPYRTYSCQIQPITLILCCLIRSRQSCTYLLIIQKQIQPFTSDYQLEVIVADELLEQNIRQSIATCQVTFRKSL